MRKKLFNILKYVLFLAAGIFVFWWVYKDESPELYKDAFRNLNYFWIVVSVLLSLLSIVSRAVRWNMLIRPLGYRPKVYNSFLAVLIMYFVNLLLPRAGEVFRCTILGRYEKIPFAKLAGTVFVERLADFVTLVFLAVVIIASQLGVFITFFSTHPDVREKLLHLLSARNILLAAASLALIALILLLSRRYLRKRTRQQSGFARRLRLIRHNFIQGIRSIAKMEKKWLFLGHTALIFASWLMMLYVVFLAFGPTSHLNLVVGMITFLMGGLAMLAPVQGGKGPWHFMVYETLFIYGIDKADGKIFALIAHATTNLIYLVFGLVALAIIPFVNPSPRK